MSAVNPASAQSKRENNFQVEMQRQSPVPGGYSIELVDVYKHMVVATSGSGGPGEYSFRGLPEGQYIARVVDDSGRVVREEMVSFHGATPVARINAPAPDPYHKPTGERISVMQLQHPPSKKASKLFREAQKLSQAGKHDKAAAALEKAIEDSPKFANAHTNLGAQYMHLGQFEKAADEAQRAMELGGRNIHDLVNLALAQWTLGRMADALRTAREAVYLDKTSLTAHFVAGSLMAMNPATIGEGIQHLELAADKIPAASQNLAKARQLMAGMR